jgi:spore coat protein CotH
VLLRDLGRPLVGPALHHVALQNLLLNFDDMAGPGRNYYLWYDLDTKRFTVVGWDYNLTFSGDAAQGPHDEGRMGGGDPPADMELPEGFQLPKGFQLPEGMQPPGGQNAGGGHKLEERFLASPAFTKVYEDAYRDLYQQVISRG